MLLVVGSCDSAVPLRLHSPPQLVATSLTPDGTGAYRANKFAPIELDYDQLLSPRSVVRANVSLRTGELGIAIRLRWNPSAHRVAIEFAPGDVRDDLEYVLNVRESLQSWDGVPTGRAVAFRLRWFEGVPSRVEPAVSFSATILPLFRRSCAVLACHAGASAVLGLDLSSAEAIARTAILRIASENPSMTGGQDRTEPQWSGLARIAPHEPEQSFLMYKILGDGPIRGDRMPFGLAPLGANEVAQMNAWITQGARTDN
jgi:hypothetical protein